MEWHRLIGSWCPQSDREASADAKWVSGRTSSVNRNFWNKSFTATLTYNILPHFGLVGDAYYIEVSDGLSVYRGKNDPMSKTNVIPYLAGGVFYNSKFVSLISRISHISRSNLQASGGFSDSKGESTKLAFLYDIRTLGWTTDAVLTPFKGFQLHLMLTLQNPVYKNFSFDVFGEHYDYDGIRARVTSKTLIEIEFELQLEQIQSMGQCPLFQQAIVCLSWHLVLSVPLGDFCRSGLQCHQKDCFQPQCRQPASSGWCARTYRRNQYSYRSYTIL